MPEVALMVFGPVHKSRGASACDAGRYRSRRREGKPVNLRGDSRSQVWNVLLLYPFRYHPSSGTGKWGRERGRVTRP
jgi:hypothetical protein